MKVLRGSLFIAMVWGLGSSCFATEKSVNKHDVEVVQQCLQKHGIVGVADEIVAQRLSLLAHPAEAADFMHKLMFVETEGFSQAFIDNVGGAYFSGGVVNRERMLFYATDISYQVNSPLIAQLARVVSDIDDVHERNPQLGKTKINWASIAKYSGYSLAALAAVAALIAAGKYGHDWHSRRMLRKKRRDEVLGGQADAGRGFGLFHEAEESLGRRGNVTTAEVPPAVGATKKDFKEWWAAFKASSPAAAPAPATATPASTPALVVTEESTGDEDSDDESATRDGEYRAGSPAVAEGDTGSGSGSGSGEGTEGSPAGALAPDGHFVGEDGGIYRVLTTDRGTESAGDRSQELAAKWRNLLKRFARGGLAPAPAPAVVEEADAESGAETSPAPAAAPAPAPAAPDVSRLARIALGLDSAPAVAPAVAEEEADASPAPAAAAIEEEVSVPGFEERDAYENVLSELLTSVSAAPAPAPAEEEVVDTGSEAETSPAPAPAPAPEPTDARALAHAALAAFSSTRSAFSPTSPLAPAPAPAPAVSPESLSLMDSDDTSGLKEGGKPLAPVLSDSSGGEEGEAAATPLTPKQIREIADTPVSPSKGSGPAPRVTIDLSGSATAAPPAAAAPEEEEESIESGHLDASPQGAAGGASPTGKKRGRGQLKATDTSNGIWGEGPATRAETTSKKPRRRGRGRRGRRGKGRKRKESDYEKGLRLQAEAEAAAREAAREETQEVVKERARRNAEERREMAASLEGTPVATDNDLFRQLLYAKKYKDRLSAYGQLQGSRVIGPEVTMNQAKKLAQEALGRE